MKKLLLVLLIMAFSLLGGVASAQMSPSVEVLDQISFGTVVVPSVVSAGPGWIVIHADNNGAPGPVAGYAPVVEGVNESVLVVLNPAIVTPILYAMLHEDNNEIGVYEFGSVEGADGPVSDDAGVITPPFAVELLYAESQFVNADNTFIAAYIVTSNPGWLVIHSDNNGAPGPVLGSALVNPGININVSVPLNDEAAPITPVLWPMMHYDTGEMGVYEFGVVEGEDLPVVLNGVVSTTPITTAPTIVVSDQILLNSDAVEMEMMEPVLYISEVLSESNGFVVVHQDNDGAPGPVAGFAPVSPGLNRNVEVLLDSARITPVMWPMLHVDDNVVGEYEFGAVEGADAPVFVNEQIVMLPINVAPSFSATPKPLTEDGILVIERVLADAPGWMVIHASVDGSVGPVLGFTPVNVGLNLNVAVLLDFSAVEGAATDEVFPMLHYDTNELGVYEFGSVEGADVPVFVGGQMVVGPLAITE